MSRFINIGYGNLIQEDKITAILSPDSAPVKRQVQAQKDSSTAIDATQGRKTQSVIYTTDGRVVLSALLPETIGARCSNNDSL